jgi:PAS domain S-box-containing protein
VSDTRLNRETVTLKVERTEQTNTQRFSRSALMEATLAESLQPADTQTMFTFEGNALVAQLFAEVYDGVIVSDLDGVIVFANERICTLTDATREFICTRNVIDLVSGSNENLVYAVLEAINSDAYAFLEASCRRPDGTTFPVEITVNALRMSEQPHLCFFIRPVERRFARERVLTESEERCRSLIESLSNFYWELDREGRVTYCSEAVVDSLGVPASELIGESLFDHIPADTRAERYEQFRRAGERDGGVLANFEVRLQDRDGEYLPVLLSGIPIHSLTGDITGTRGIAVVVEDGGAPAS